MGKTHSKPVAARHGRGTAWARHAMCESAFSGVLSRRTSVSCTPLLSKVKESYFFFVPITERFT